MLQQKLNSDSSPYDAMQVANYIIDYCSAQGLEMTSFRLQKVLFFCQCYYLKTTKSLLFRDPIEKTIYGSNVRYVYGAFSGYGINNLKIKEIYVSNNKQLTTYNKKDILKEDRNLIQSVVSELACIETTRFVSIIRSLPCWKEQREALENGNYNLVFSIDEMRLVF